MPKPRSCHREYGGGGVTCVSDIFMAPFRIIAVGNMIVRKAITLQIRNQSAHEGLGLGRVPDGNGTAPVKKVTMSSTRILGVSGKSASNKHMVASKPLQSSVLLVYRYPPP
ncbi:unnamed protein product, partial [Ectocarpus sp. 8 AP-2014]